MSYSFGQQAKRKVFVSYHHGGDQAYYDAFSKAFVIPTMSLPTIRWSGN